MKKLLTISLVALAAVSQVQANTGKAKKNKAPVAAAAESVVDMSPKRANEIVVSDSEYNHFIFPHRIVKLLFPSGNTLIVNKDEERYLAGNTQVLLEFQKGRNTPNQMIAELQNGDVIKAYLMPRPVPGVTHSFGGGAAKPKAKEKDGGEAVEESSSADLVVTLLEAAVQNKLDSSFVPVALGAHVSFENFSVIPLVARANGAYKISVFSLVAKPETTAVVAPAQFYKDSVLGVLLTGSHVSSKESPTLYVIEEVSQ